MKKISFLFLILPMLLILSGCTLINGLTLSSDAKLFVGLWESSGWDDEYDHCYYDFRSDGRVFVTEWTDNLETTNNLLIPNYFNYSVKDGYLTMEQFGTIVKIEFMIENEDSIPEGYCTLRVNDWSSDYDFDNIEYGYDFNLVRRVEYSRSLIGGIE